MGIVYNLFLLILSTEVEFVKFDDDIPDCCFMVNC